MNTHVNPSKSHGYIPDQQTMGFWWIYHGYSMFRRQNSSNRDNPTPWSPAIVLSNPKLLLVGHMWFGKSKLILVSIHIYPCIFFVESHIILWFMIVSPSLFTSTASWPGKFTSVFAEMRLSIIYCWFSPQYLDGQIDIVCTYCVWVCIYIYMYIIYVCYVYPALPRPSLTCSLPTARFTLAVGRCSFI